VDTLWPLPLSCLELLGAQAAEMTMPARAIVERLDVVGHVVQCELQLEVIGTAETPPRVADIRLTMIRVNQRAARSPSAHGRQYRVEHDLPVDGGARTPS